jgi:hypothetical protein
MKRVFAAIIVGVVMLGVAELSCSVDTACHSNSDCPSGAYCYDGACVVPTPPTTSSTVLFQCGQIDISCNCAVTSAYPGQVSATSRCVTGQHTFYACMGACPGGGVPWQAVCSGC